MKTRLIFLALMPMFYSCSTEKSEDLKITESVTEQGLNALAKKYDVPIDFTNGLKFSGTNKEGDIRLLEHAMKACKNCKDSVTALSLKYKESDERILAELNVANTGEERQKLFKKHDKEMKETQKRPPLIMPTFEEFLAKEPGVKRRDTKDE